MDSLKPSSNVMVIAATNRPNVIESALRRPGRFDRELEVIIPDEDGRHEILKIKTKDMEMSKGVDLFQIARDSHGYVGADLQQLCLEAASQCIRSKVGGFDIESEEPISEEALDTLVVNEDHFMHALKVCDPSTLRENKVEVSSFVHCLFKKHHRIFKCWKCKICIIPCTVHLLKYHSEIISINFGITRPRAL